MTECPACRRALEPADSVCSRCGAEVESLQKIDRAARDLLLRGSGLLRQRRSAEACAVFMRSYALRRSEKVAKGAAIALLCSGRFKEALRLRQKIS